jgi:uncharacterized phage-associated protein
MSAYNARKAAQVIAYFASKTPTRRIDVLKAIKLVYLADRESIKRHGFPIMDEPRVSMPHGPVNSKTYSHMQGEYDLDSCGWADFLRDRSNHQVSVKHGAPTDWDELSDAEIGVLDHVWNEFGHMSKWKLRDWTHDPENIPEWEDPDGSSLPIPIERIMLAVGVENHAKQAQSVKDQSAIEGIFQSLRKG